MERNGTPASRHARICPITVRSTNMSALAARLSSINASANAAAETDVGNKIRDMLASRQLEQIAPRKAERDAMKSVGTVVLSDIAADNATGGPVEQAKALGKHWVGDDGGETWAASIAGDHQRGILQDAVRMEAANLSLLALQVKKGARTETAAATLLLAMINAKVGARLPSPEAGGPK